MSNETKSQEMLGIKDTPLTFVDGFRGFSIHGDVVRINFFSVGVTPEGESFSNCALRMAIPLSAFKEMVDALHRAIHDPPKFSISDGVLIEED